MKEKQNILESKAAFTLAEVLITLGIIGVLAAITIPSLISNYQKNVTATRLKESFGIFSQAIRMSINDNDNISGWSRSNNDFLPTYINPYLKSVSEVNKYRIYNLGGNSGILCPDTSKPISKYYQFKDGLTYMSCGMYYNKMLILIDLNGSRRPNMLGKDVFTFALDYSKSSLQTFGSECTRKGLYSGYTAEDWTGGCASIIYYSCTKGSSWSNGYFCGALIEKDGWKISENYPW